MLKKGLFISFEGIDCCGKSTQVKLLNENLTKEGYNVVLTREPGGTEIAEKIREIILDPQNIKMSSKTELLLYAASRSQHVDEKIRPEINRGSIVISDRFFDATLAYQGFGRGLDVGSIKLLNDYACGNSVPDLTFFVDISIEETKKRTVLSGKELDRIEKEGDDFFKKTREGYLFLANEFKERIITINGERAVHEIQADILRITKEKILMLEKQ